jgi:hypothetical protein
MLRSAARAARACLLALFAAAAACGSERPSTEDYLAVVPQLVAFAESDARDNAPGVPATGALFLDLASLAAGGRSVLGQAPDSASLAAAVDRPFRHARIEDVLLCDEEGTGGGGCWVREYGVFVTVNAVRRSEGRMTALVRSISTDRRVRPTFLCDRYWRLRFVRRNGEWRLEEQTLNRSCT